MPPLKTIRIRMLGAKNKRRVGFSSIPTEIRGAQKLGQPGTLRKTEIHALHHIQTFLPSFSRATEKQACSGSVNPKTKSNTTDWIKNCSQFAYIAKLPDAKLFG